MRRTILLVLMFVLVSCTPGRAQATFYVAPNGNDAWSGTLPAPNAAHSDGPFATFERARAQVQALNKAGLSQVTVQFRAGTYYLPATVQFTAADSGSASTPIVYQNYPGESPVISGGVRVQNWTHVGGNTWKATLPASTRYFEALYYNGVRRLRPRLGGGELGRYLRFVGPVYLNAPEPPASAPNSNCSIYVSGKGWECFDRFEYNPADPISATWRNLAPPAGNACGQPAGNPALAGDIELLDFEKFSAAELRISCVDTSNHIVYLTGPTAMNESFYTALGFIPNHRYLVENVQDELKQPGQWFLDRSTTPWTLTYLARAGENPNTDTVIVPQLPQVLAASNLQYVTFQGLTFENDNFTLPPSGHSFAAYASDVSAAVSFQNSQHITFGADTVAHTSGGALEFISCIDAKSPDWCASRSTTAVTSDDVIADGAFYDIGATGIHIGLPGDPGDTEANVPQAITVQNNVVEGYGRIFPDAFGVLQGEGHNNTYTHNDVYDGYRTAIGICFCAGQKGLESKSHDDTISFNHVYNLFQGIMNDAGSIYIQIANPSNPFKAPPGNKMLNNKIHDVSDASALDEDGYGGDGLYVDNVTGLIDIENNLVYRVSGNAVNFAESPAEPSEASIVKNNILAYARGSMINVSNPWYNDSLPNPPIQIFVATNNLFYFDRGGSSSPPFSVQGGCTYAGQAAYTTYQQWGSNLYWRTDGTFASDAQAFHVQSKSAGKNPCYFGARSDAPWDFFQFSGWQKLGEDAQSVIQDPRFANPTYPADDYSLPKGSPGVGFMVFDAGQAGRLNPILKPPSVPPTFPTKTFDPATDF